MTRSIQGKNLVLVISVIAWGLALFFSAKLAAADTNIISQDPTSGWYETEDPLNGIHQLENHRMSKMTKSSDNAAMKKGNATVASWYETEDSLPKYEPKNPKAMAQKIPANSKGNKIGDLDKYSWYETEDALPQI